MNRIQTLMLLVDMSTSGMVTVKIDEKKGICHILSCKFKSKVAPAVVGQETLVRMRKL